jgi:tRNA (guanine37-N1)-methyltransferase
MRIKAMWRASVLTLFPEIFPGPLNISLAGRALEAKIWSLDVHNIKSHGIGSHRNVDDSPAGGGPGMVMRADVAAAAIDAAHARHDSRPLVYLTPRGAPLTQKRVLALVDGPGVVLFCARFEGLDERVVAARKMEEISIGDIVLAGGEIAACALIEACVRLLPGVMGAEKSALEESFEDGLLEYPHYTRPQIFEGQTVPDILNSGNHGEIARWRRKMAENLTKTRRPDLFSPYEKASQSAIGPASKEFHPIGSGKKNSRKKPPPEGK